MNFRAHIWLVLGGLSLQLSYGQARESISALENFYQKQAFADADYEHSLLFLQEKEERDFWTDQRGFERELFLKNPRAFRIYLKSKAKAYASFQAQCNAKCLHGDYYYLQSSYYVQFGTEAGELGESFQNSGTQYRLLAISNNKNHN